MGSKFTDEFTNTKENNSELIGKSEYGNVQDNEFSGTGEMRLHKSAYNPNLVKKSTKSVDNIEQGSTTATGGTSASAGSEGVALTSSTTASTVAATGVSVVAVASTVAVTSLGVLTGISVALHDYDFKLNSLIISSNQLNYSLSIIDKEMTDSDMEHFYDQFDEKQGESKLPFLIRIYNNSYDSSQELFYYEQSGVFSNLSLGDKYNIVVSENRYGGQVIYEDTFITFKNTAFLDFSFYGDSDFGEGTFDVSMNFVDEKELLDSFKLSLYYPDAPEKTIAEFDLQEINGTQSVSFLDENKRPLIDVTQEYGYSFTYVNDGKLIEYKSGTVYFYDREGRSSQFNSLIFDKTANFLEQTMVLQLDYIDYFNYYDNFVLELIAHYNEEDPTTGQGQGTANSWEDSREIELLTTTEPQTISLMEYDINIEEPTFTYVLKADYRGTTTVLVEEAEPFSFADNSGAVSEFYGLEYNQKMSWRDYTMSFRLDYVDDFGRYDNFVVHMTENYDNGEESDSRSFDIPLANTDEVQTVDVSEYEPTVYEVEENYRYQYYLTAEYRGVETTLVSLTAPFELHDDGSSESTDPETWNTSNFIFDKTANYLNNSFEVQLDYVDDFYYYSNFVLTLWPQGYNAEFEFALSDTTDVQKLTLDEQEHFGYSFDYEYTYELTCDYRGVSTSLIKDDSGFTFADNSGFHSLVFDGSYDYGNSTFDLRLDYEDPNGDFSDFVFRLFDEEDLDQPYCEIPLNPVSTVQTINMETYDINPSSYYYYSLSCSYQSNTIVLAHSEESFQFHDADMIPSASITFIDNKINYQTGEMTVQLDIEDKYGFMSDIYITFFGKGSEDADDYSSEFDVYLDNTEEPQVISIPRDTGETDIDFIHYDLAYNLYWSYSTLEDEDTGSLFNGYKELELENSLITHFYGAESNYEIYKETVNAGTEDEYEQYVMWINFNYIDENGCYEDMHPCFQPVDYQGYLVVADLYYSNDRVPAGWYKYTVGPNSGEVFENGEGICDGEEWLLVVEGWNDEDPYDDQPENNMTKIFTEVCSPTFVDNPTPQVYGIEYSTEILGGEGYLDISPLFAGSSSDFTQMQLILEDESDNVYTYSISVLSPYMGIDLADDDDGSVTEVYDCFNGDHTFTITFKYAYASKPNDVITMVIGEGVQFNVSV